MAAPGLPGGGGTKRGLAEGLAGGLHSLHSLRGEAGVGGGIPIAGNACCCGIVMGGIIPSPCGGPNPCGGPGCMAMGICMFIGAMHVSWPLATAGKTEQFTCPSSPHLRQCVDAKDTSSCEASVGHAIGRWPLVLQWGQKCLRALQVRLSWPRSAQKKHRFSSQSFDSCFSEPQTQHCFAAFSSTNCLPQLHFAWLWE